jgi:hypothetical protein
LFGYLLKPDPGPVGVNVDPLGDAFGPMVLPDGFLAVSGPVVLLPLMPVVVLGVLFIVEPALEFPPPAPAPAPPAPAPPPACASANVLESANAQASTIVLSFMDCFPFQIQRRNKLALMKDVPLAR